jgi:hypothetical protein
MSKIQLDFSSLEKRTKRIPAGTHIVTIVEAEIKQSARSGNNYLALKYEDTEGNTAYDTLTLVPQAMWRVKLFMDAVFATDFQEKIDLNTDNLSGKKLIVKVEDEEYVNSEGNPATKSKVLSEYKGISTTDSLGVSPKVPNIKALVKTPPKDENPSNPDIEVANKETIYEKPEGKQAKKFPWE